MEGDETEKARKDEETKLEETMKDLENKPRKMKDEKEGVNTKRDEVTETTTETERLKKSINVINKLRPATALLLTIVGKIVHTAGDVGGKSSLKIMGVSFESAALWIDPGAGFEKRVDEAIMKLQSDVSFIKSQVQYLTEKVDKIYFLSGVRRIQTICQELLTSPDVKFWAFHFTSHKTSLEESLADFRKENVKEFLDRIGTTKCLEDLDEFYRCLDLLQTTRGMYFLIQHTYYSHLPQKVLDELPNLDVKKLMAHELDNYIRDINIIMDTAEELCFFIHVYKTVPEHWPKIGYLPDIPCTPQYFYKEVSLHKIHPNPLAALFPSLYEKVKLYYLPTTTDTGDKICKTVYKDGDQETNLQKNGRDIDGPYCKRSTTGVILQGIVKWGFDGRKDVFAKKDNNIYYCQAIEPESKIVESHEFDEKTRKWIKIK